MNIESVFYVHISYPHVYQLWTESLKGKAKVSKKRLWDCHTEIKKLRSSKEGVKQTPLYSHYFSTDAWSQWHLLEYPQVLFYTTS